MSRHKLVKTMNLDDELDDFDGADFDDDYNGLEDSQLQNGIREVRTILGPSVIVNERSIEDALWHYYYDVEKTVNYLLQQQAPTTSNKPVEKNKASSTGKSKVSAEGFFLDSPWRHVPPERRARILIEPLFPRGGLRGGSSGTGEGKMSKLAALAAARKKKENGKHVSSDSQGSNASVTMLEKLNTRAEDSEALDLRAPANVGRDAPLVLTKPLSIKQSRKYPRKRDLSLTATAGNDTPEEVATPTSGSENSVQEAISQSNPTATPSTFAKTMFGDTQDPLPSAMPPIQSLTLSSPRALRANAKIDPFAGPSPDDVVAKAQNSSKGAKAAKKAAEPATNDKATINLAADVEAVAIDGGPKPRSKNLNVLAEFEKSRVKNAANFVVIGHVDAGKSTLMGRLLYDLKVVDQRTVDRYRKEAEKIGKSSFALAWVLDQGTEERNRGVTIDIAMNRFETSKTSFTILDAPGHRDFIPNMIAGASQADFAVLVIDAGTGNFESGLKGQTKEHALLVRSMGVQKIVIAVNKLDTVQWSKERFDEIQQQVSAFLTAAGFQQRNIAFVPCSGLHGENIVKRAEAAQAGWYTGPVLIDQLEASEPTSRSLNKPLRITIADIFRGGVQNPLSISGRLDSGSLQVGDRVITMPAKETAVIKGIDVDSEPADWAVAGQNAILHLTDIEQQYLKAGDVICPPSAPIQNVTSLTVKILAFDHVTPMHIEVHRGRMQIPGRITQLMAILDKVSGAVVGKKKPRLVQPGSIARVVVQLDSAVPLEAPGKVILRAGGQTVAAGLLE
ncbi:MAG: hypothetical protein Q9192_003378 [Flavoplaca navasiana]